MSELEYLKQKFSIYYDYFRCREDPQWTDIMQETKTKVDHIEPKDIKWLRSLIKEIDSNLYDPQIYPYVKELLQLFKDQLGEDIEGKQSRRLKKIESILKRGVIRTRDEYELIEQRVEELIQVYDRDGATDTEVAALNKLLINPKNYKEV